MYLSDMFVTALKTGGQDRVEAMFEVLLNLPDNWWEFRGCKNWLKVAMMQYQENPERFMENLTRYADSQEWANGKPFITIDEEE